MQGESVGRASAEENYNGYCHCNRTDNSRECRARAEIVLLSELRRTGIYGDAMVVKRKKIARLFGMGV